MTIRNLAILVLVMALLSGLVRCFLIEFAWDVFLVCWLGLGCLSQRWIRLPSPLWLNIYIIIAWPCVLILLAILVVSWAVRDCFGHWWGAE